MSELKPLLNAIEGILISFERDEVSAPMVTFKALKKGNSTPTDAECDARFHECFDELKLDHGITPVEWEWDEKDPDEDEWIVTVNEFEGRTRIGYIALHHISECFGGDQFERCLDFLRERRDQAGDPEEWWDEAYQELLDDAELGDDIADVRETIFKRLRADPDDEDTQEAFDDALQEAV